ncbi:hypothetical protein GX51_01248 [Blastomyces parvus]|uniref:Xylanolytic transcriptional activator regulatory domain-containing protein n=1 Tax=Blastomyces parvus TaxID=2060905 RepID=A0A2B7XI24_9EURO|nr:hypothetical protein GX51_01248 [Blastomyces parvus]
MARLSPKSRQAFEDRRESAIRTSPSRLQGFNPASTYTHISSRPLPTTAHSQSMPPSPNSLAAQFCSPTVVTANMAFNPRHQRAVSDLGPTTYTPRTGKVSKALKGKKVHQCQHEGCGKLFSRAEHVRGDKLNALPETIHSDTHIQSSPVSMTSEPQGLMSPISLNQQHASVPAVHHEGDLMSIGSLVQPGTQHHFANDYSMSVWCEPERGLVRGDLFSDSPQVNTDDTMVYSSPDSCRSPASDVNPFQFPQRTPIMNQSYSEPFYHPQIHESSFKMASTASDWTPLQAGTSTSQMLPISLEGDILQTVGEPSLRCRYGRTRINILVALPVSVPFFPLDRNEWSALRRELNFSPGVILRNDGMEIIDTAQWQDCLECYWKNFHPLVPIVHRPTFCAAKPIPLISAAMVAIGSQYDTRPNAKEYSLSILEACLNLLAKRNPITIRSRISDIQAVFLLEYLSKYRSRKADVTLSPRFKALYGTFIQNRHWASKNPLAIFNTLSEDEKRSGLGKAYSFWVENETRRRILQAAFLLDVQQSTLFQQPLAFLQANIRTLGSNIRHGDPIDLPFPCRTELWESAGIEEWAQYARVSEPLTLSSAAARIICQNDSSLKLDAFQSNLILSYAMLTNMRSMDLEQTLEPFIGRLEHGMTAKARAQYTESSSRLTHPSHTLFAYHALLAAYRAPLRALLIVSGESWLFNQKLEDQAEYQQAKKTLRLWVSDTDEMKKAVWHALRVLEYAIDHPVLGDTPELIYPNTGLSHASARFSDGSCYITPSNVNAHNGNDIHRTDNMFPTPGYLIERNTMLPHSNRADPTTTLHSNWALYICALICWAYGAGTSTATTANDSLPYSTPASPRTYVTRLMLFAPSWSQISRNSIPDHVRRDTCGLLAYIRTRWLQPDRMGGLLNEGARVLHRLSERHHPNIIENKNWEF